MLDFQLVQAPFRFGVDEGTDPKQVPFGTLLTAQNVEWVKSGRLQKRSGTTTLTANIVGGGTLSNARRLFTRGDELCLVAGSDLSLYSYTSSGWKLTANQGRIPDVGLEWETLQAGYDGALASDVAITSAGLLVHAWITGSPSNGVNPSGKLYYQVIDRNTGAKTTTATAFDSSSTPTLLRVLASGTDWVIVYKDGVNIKATVNGAAAVTLKTDAKNTGAMDACVIGSNFVVAYNLDANGIGLYAYSFAATPVLQTSGAVTGETADLITAISVDGNSSDLLWVGYFVSNGGSSKFRVASATASTLVQSLAPTDVDTSANMNPGQPAVGVKRTASTTCCYAYSVTSTQTPGSAYVDGVTVSMSITNSGTLGSLRKSAGLRLMTQPFYLNGRLHAFAGRFITGLGNVSATTPTYAAGDSYLIEVEPYSRALPHRLVGKVEVLTAGQWRTGFVSKAASAGSNTEYLAMIPTLAGGITGTLPFGAIFQACQLVTATTTTDLPADMWRSVTIGPETYLAAGVLAAYDGRMAFDFGWASDCPFGEDFAIAGGGSMDDGDHVYQVVPEYRSAAGILHRGPANAQRTATTATGSNSGSVTLKVIPCHLSQKYDDTGSAFVADPIPPLLAIYRRVFDDTEAPPQRLTVEPLYNTLLQSLYTSPLTFTDTRSDFNIGNINVHLSEQPAVYTAGGELDDFQPPALRTVCLYRNRIFGIAGDKKTVWFSKDHSTNPGVAPGFNPEFRLTFNDTLTGLAVLDERLFVFSESGIYYFSGDGPAPNGDGADYGTPNKLQTDVGCTNPRGLVSFPGGILFVAGDGEEHSEIHLLDRSLSVSLFSQQVQDLLDTYPYVTSAVLVPAKNQVRFSCNDANSSGVVLVYDYVEKQWSHFFYANPLSESGYGLRIVDACMHGGVYTFVTDGATVYKENSSTYLDAGEWVTAKLETAWIHAGGPLAYHSVRNFRIDGVSVSNHRLSISVGFDGSTAYQQGPETFVELTSGVTTPASSVTANISIGTRRKCRSIRFKIEDGYVQSESYARGSGAGAKWSSMGIEVGIKRGFGKLPASQGG